LPATNNISERHARRQAIGRNNWIFVGSDDGAEVNTTFTTLLASCHLHGIEPEAYLRDILCLLPGWPTSRVLELAPCNWNETRHKPEAQQRLAANVFRRAILELDAIHSQTP
jgi:transposase